MWSRPIMLVSCLLVGVFIQRPRTHHAFGDGTPLPTLTGGRRGEGRGIGEKMRIEGKVCIIVR